MRLRKQWLHYLDKEPTTIVAAWLAQREIMKGINYKGFYTELAELFGEGAKTYLHVKEDGTSQRYLCIPGEDHRPLTDDENRDYNELEARYRVDLAIDVAEAQQGESESPLATGRVNT